MTTPTEAVHTVLTGYAGLTALVSTRIYSIIAPQESAKPYLVTQKVSQLRENTMADAGGNGVENQRCRINIYSDTLAESETAAEQVRLAFEAAASANFKAVQIFNTDTYEDGTHLYRVIVDYSIWYRH